MTLSATDHKIIQQLREILSTSHDPDRPVGAIIADPAGRILATGTNRPPLGFGFDISDTHSAIRDDPSWKYYMLEHAERNAVITALREGHDLNGTTLYGTLFPCADCARALVAAGIRRLVVPGPGLNPDRDTKWQEHYEYARQIFDLAKVRIETYSPAELNRMLSGQD